MLLGCEDAPADGVTAPAVDAVHEKALSPVRNFAQLPSSGCAGCFLVAAGPSGVHV